MDTVFHYLFGPVPSRRLGLSLGVDVIPKKLCTLDCIYCEVGKTDMRGLRRKEYVPAREVLAELERALREYTQLDFITFSGSGEPTLNSKLGMMIHELKLMTRIPIAVITNGTLLFREDVRRDLLEADVVLPSLDAATQETFQKINRPHPQLKIETIIEGLKLFRSEYTGKLWLEVLVVEGVNTSDADLTKLREAIEYINPDRVQLNTVIRPPAESVARPVSPERLEMIKGYFGERCEVIGTFTKEPVQQTTQIDTQAVIALLRRRGMTANEIGLALGVTPRAAQHALETLQHEGLVIPSIHADTTYYLLNEEILESQ